MRVVKGKTRFQAALSVNKGSLKNHPNGASAARRHLGNRSAATHVYINRPMATSRRRSISISGCHKAHLKKAA
ncbi:hypothetical protein [Kingella oralis]